MSIRVSLLAALLMAITLPAYAQFGGLGSAVKRAAEREAEREVERRAREAVRCALTDVGCIKAANSNKQDVEFTDASGNVITDASGQPVQTPEAATARIAETSAGSTAAPGTGVWRNYDFVPGSHVRFALDLDSERVGRFPASQLEFVEGNAQIVEIDGARALEVTAPTTFYINLPEALPEDYTLELEARTGAPNFNIRVFFDPITEMKLTYRTYQKHYLDIWRGGGIGKNAGMISSTDNKWEIAEEFVPVKFQNDGSYAIVYMGVDRVSNMPNADFGRSNRIEFNIAANQDRPAYIRNLVLAVGLDDLYDTIASGDSWTTRGILFDVDSDVLRPESTPVLDQLSRTLQQNGDLAIVIEGHTDSSGDDAHNRDLSARRAQSVVTWLVGQGTESGRLEAVGKGEDEPAADNGTPEGRQENRRVVIRKR